MKRGKKGPGGRPRSEQPRGRMVNVRLSEEEYHTLSQAALQTGHAGVGTFMRFAALNLARNFLHRP